MKDNNTTNSEEETPKELGPTSIDTQTNAKGDRPKQTNRKSKKGKKWPLWRHWKQANRKTQAKWVAQGLIIVTGLGGLGTYIWDHIQRERHFQTEHRPRVEFSRAPQLLGSFACTALDTRAMQFGHGRTNIWLKNVGNGDAVNVYVAYFFARPVADPPSTNLDFNTIMPTITDETCRVAPTPKMKMFSLNRGQETVVDMVGGNGWLRVDPKTEITSDTAFEIVAPTCVYYFDEFGKPYGTCDTYRLVRNEGVRFACKESPITGQFQHMLINSCED
jgi:hypothetical protein